jgi:hypothetical protein
MNLFRSLNTAVNQINSIGNYINQSGFNPNSDHITDLIRSCTYAEEYICMDEELNFWLRNQWDKYCIFFHNTKLKN